MSVIANSLFYLLSNDDSSEGRVNNRTVACKEKGSLTREATQHWSKGNGKGTEVCFHLSEMYKLYTFSVYVGQRKREQTAPDLKAGKAVCEVFR